MAAMLLLHATTLLLSAALLFLVQPMWARLLLPHFGGSPAVWNTAMVFFQAALLAGYAWAHFASTRLQPRTRALAHLAVVGLPLLLPTVLPTGAAATTWPQLGPLAPIVALLACLTLGVGPAFLALATTSPMLQRWFGMHDHPAARDPYFLYGASNLGSLLGLLAFPLLEPWLDLDAQIAHWRLGYLGLFLLTLACAWPLLRGQVDDRPDAPETTPEPLPDWPRRLRWVALAAVPSSLMLGVTTHLSNVVAAAPLLWVLPLALYLLSFVLAFARRPPSVPLLARIAPLLVAPLLPTLAIGATHPISVLVPLHLLTFLALATLCHARLAADRPAPVHLTAFYLWLAVGGVVGGLVNGFAAPLLLDSVAEYPVGLAVGCMLGLAGLQQGQVRRGRRAILLALPGLATASGLLAVRQLGVSDGGVQVLAATGIFALGGVGCYLLSRQGVIFGFAIMGFLAATSLWHHPFEGRVVRAERGFFGVHRVTLDERPPRYDPKAPAGFRQLFHGVTVHGREALDAATCEPLLYYHRTGPVGQVLTRLPVDPTVPVGVVGLGTGAVACYAKPGQPWTFFELDPLVTDIARNDFHYLRRSQGRIEVVPGDARLSLQAPGPAFGVLVLDAYSSDSVPLHLLTREAMALYLKRLRPDGVLAMHISNRSFDLAPPLASLAHASGLLGWLQDDADVGKAQREAGKSESRWVLLARNARDLDGFDADPRWKPLAQLPGQRPWTDARSSVLEAFVWR